MDTLVVSIVGSVSIMVGFIIGYYLRGQWVAESLKNLSADKQRLADEGVVLKQEVQALKAEVVEKGSQVSELMILKTKYETENMGYASRLQELTREIQGKGAEIEKVLGQVDQLRREVSAKEVENTRLAGKLLEVQSLADQRLHDLQEFKENLKKEFKLQSAEVIKEQSDANAKQFEERISPFKEFIENFKKDLTTKYDTTLRDTASLTTQLQTFHASTMLLSAQAENLTKALRSDSKKQGNWGETILQRILEVAGFEKDVNYRLQPQFKNGLGNIVIPDAVVYLPEDKQVIIDSKVSLLDYSNYISAEDEQEKAQHLKKHVQSIEAHVINLSNKDYSNLKDLNTLNYVIMFVPNDGAFLEAIHSSEGLFENANKKGVIIVSSSMLLATLRLFQLLWSQHNSIKNVDTIVKEAGEIYGKVKAVLEDLDTLESGIRRSYETHIPAIRSKLGGKGGVVSRVEKMRLMGARSSTRIDSKKLLELDVDLGPENETDEQTS